MTSLPHQRDQRSRLYGGTCHARWVITSCFPATASGFRATSARHWSDSWDAELGYIEPHTLHSGDPVRKRMAAERQAHPRVVLNLPMIAAVATAIGKCRAQSEWRVAAASVESTHLHLLLTYAERDIDITVKWLKDQTTKTVHRSTPHHGPVWCKGCWRGFVFDPIVWRNTRRYIERHNERRGASIRPYPWIDDVPNP